MIATMMRTGLALPGNAVAAIDSQLGAAGFVDTVYRLTLVLVLLHGTNLTDVQIPLRALAIIMLVLPGFLRSGWLWGGMTACLLIGNVKMWFAIDNHHYLITYWVLAVTLSLRADRADEYLRSCSRMLIGLAFAFAVMWKVLAGEYIDGSFFSWTFLTDTRLQQVAASFRPGSLSELVEFRQAVGAVAQWNLTGFEVPVPRISTVEWIVVPLSVLTIVGEGIVGALHLSSRAWASRWRNAFLVFFIAVTYVLLPVPGFAFLLTVMGFAGRREDDRINGVVYVLLLVWLQVQTFPWKHLLPS